MAGSNSRLNIKSPVARYLLDSQPQPSPPLSPSSRLILFFLFLTLSYIVYSSLKYNVPPLPLRFLRRPLFPRLRGCSLVCLSRRPLLILFSIRLFPPCISPPHLTCHAAQGASFSRQLLRRRTSLHAYPSTLRSSRDPGNRSLSISFPGRRATVLLRRR